ncbi:hematological and neurological expressed 1 protein-like isoform X2 [Sinocyclocheilus anshuiensis]|uniref:hematological and neurological expressed 1 protein-like isoform X2 n=1 Tax=Sinocyclocheilus anshuiensis TaxID=1608454 RepID=UPI0007B85E73|nr:PREDICTED: hematological and neurological expressed 1 protein-like isoform X2 [Sinocyclocheilus anshuiensis]
MTTTTTFQGMDPTARSSSRVLRPPGGGSNICFGTDEEKPVKKNKMAFSIFAEPEDPHAHRRNNPPSGKPTGVLCGEPSAPLRRCTAQPANQSNTTVENNVPVNGEANSITVEPIQEQDDTPAPPCLSASEQPAAGVPSGRRNPPGGKSSLIFG